MKIVLEELRQVKEEDDTYIALSKDLDLFYASYRNISKYFSKLILIKFHRVNNLNCLKFNSIKIFFI